MGRLARRFKRIKTANGECAYSANIGFWTRSVSLQVKGGNTPRANRRFWGASPCKKTCVSNIYQTTGGHDDCPLLAILSICQLMD